MSEVVSVVIPMHNRALDIEKCVNSILYQTYEQLEVILIDDGSTDETLQVCKTLAMKDKRIKVFWQENGGPVKARKKGIENASGKYISFVDSDDWIEPEMYREMVHKMETYAVDVVCAGYYQDTGTSSGAVYERMPGGRYVMTDETVYKEGLFIDEACAERKISSSLCNKLFKISLITDVFMRLNDCIYYAEDAAVVYSTIVKANAIYVLDKAYYHYVAHEGSIVHSKNKRILEQLNLVSDFLEREFEGHSFSDYLLRQKDLIIADCLFKGLNSSFFNTKNVLLPTYMIPELELNPNMSVGIYGAGKVGKCYFHQLKNVGYKKVKLIDQKAAQLGDGVIHPSQIDCKEFDVIVIGVREETVAFQIIKELKEMYDIPEKMMKWKSPVSFLQMCKVDKNDGEEP